MKRAEQYKTLRQFMKTSLSMNGYRDDDMVIIVGDLNVDGRSKVRFDSQALSNIPMLEVNLRVLSETLIVLGARSSKEN